MNVVPRRLARRPPTRGVHVLFRENAEMSRENSVLFVPISRESRDFRGPNMYDALRAQMSGQCEAILERRRLTSDFRRSVSKRTTVLELGSGVLGLEGPSL